MPYSFEVKNNCFSDLVGLKEHCNEKQALLINKLDINEDFIDSIIGKDYASPNKFFQEKLQSSIDDMQFDLNTFFNKSYKLNVATDHSRVGYFKDDKSIDSAKPGKLIGLFFNLYENEYQSLIVTEINLLLDYTGTVDLLIKDVFSNVVLNTIPIEVEVGIVKTTMVKINISGINKIFIGYDSTDKPAMKTLLYKSANCCGTSKSYINSSQTIDAVLIDGTDIEKYEYTGGISLMQYLKCDHIKWLCGYRELFAIPLLYKTAQSIMYYALNVSPNERTNTTNSLNKEQLQIRYNEYAAEYETKMQQVVDGIEIPCNKCFKCNSYISHRIVIT